MSDTGFVGESSASGVNSIVETVSIAGASSGSAGLTSTGSGASVLELLISNTNGESAIAAASALDTASESLCADFCISPKIFFIASSAETSSGVSFVTGNSGAASGTFCASGCPALSPNCKLPSEGVESGATGTAKGASGVRLTKPASAIAFAAAPTSPPSTVDSKSSCVSISKSLFFFFLPNRPFFSSFVTLSTKEMEICIGVFGILAEACVRMRPAASHWSSASVRILNISLWPSAS